MKKRELASCLCFIVVLCQCRDPNSGAGKTAGEETGPRKSQARVLFEEIEYFDFDEPEKDAQRNIEKGDQRFIGVRSFALLLPGLDSVKAEWEENCRIIEGTSDDWDTTLHERLCYLTIDYAERYNRYVLEAIEQQTVDPSTSGTSDSGD